MEDSLVEELDRMLDAGLKVAMIAEELEISEGTVRNRMSQRGIKAQGQAEPAFSLNVVEMYNEGASIREIREKHRISVTQLYNILARHNVPVRKSANAGARQRQIDEAIQMYEDGVGIAVIVAETGVSQPTLHQEVHSRGIALRRPRK